MRNTAADFPSYLNAYMTRYANTVVDCQRVGTKGASLLRFERPAGRYADEATSDFALTMVQNGGFGAELDCAAGGFPVNVASGQLFVSPPFIATDNAFHGTAKGVTLVFGYAHVTELLSGVDVLPQSGPSTRTLCNDFIRVSINRLCAVAHSRAPADRVFADAAILAIFATLAGQEAKAGARAKRGLADWQLRRVMEKLESMRDISLTELAASANLSPFYFARAFKHTTGLPPHRYQQRRRMELAKELLSTTSLPIVEVAHRVGYGSSQTLARVFRKEAGASPIEYRRSTTV